MLAPVGDPGLVISAIAQTLGIKESGGQSLFEALVAHLREKQMLLLLDNFEPVLPAVPPLALPPQGSRTKNQEPGVTSQETVLGSRFSVLSLVGELTQYEAVRLFIERARAARPDFAITNANAPAVAEICHRLDGLPLSENLEISNASLDRWTN
jgi:predicted ATPase